MFFLHSVVEIGQRFVYVVLVVCILKVIVIGRRFVYVACCMHIVSPSADDVFCLTSVCCK